jgi:squalene-hopene/tetraprenyl-beta-curcumene cyclase
MHQIMQLGFLGLIALFSWTCVAAPNSGDLDLSSRLEAEFAISRASTRLLELQQEDGRWSSHPGITALAVIAIQRLPEPKDPMVQRAISQALPQLRAFADSATTAVNLDTTHLYSCAATHLALQAVSSSPEDVKRGKVLALYLENFLKRRLSSGSLLARGGVVDMPDVSNLHWAIDAVLLTRGNNLSTEQKNQIRRFLESCQEQRPPNKGGFAYAPIREGQARPIWGSLTWAGVRALLLTGYNAKSVPISSAAGWLQTNFSVSENPGLKQGGYFYYLYLTAGTNLLMESTGSTAVPANWRQLIVDHLLSTQKGDGSWTNSSAVWLENRKPLATAYAILVLSMAAQ